MKRLGLLVLSFLLISQLLFSQESPSSIKTDREKIKVQIDAIYNYLLGMRAGISFAQLETILANKTSIFDVKAVRTSYDQTAIKVQNISNVISGLTGLVSGISLITSAFSSDQDIKQIAEKSGYISLALMSSGIITSLISSTVKDKNTKERIDSSMKVFIEVSAKIAVARKAYDDVQNRRVLYDKQIIQMNEIISKIDKLNSKFTVEQFNTSEALVLISDISNSLSSLSVTIFSTIDDMTNSVSKYQQITKDIALYVVGDMNKLSDDYGSLKKQLEEFDLKYRKELIDKLVSLQNLLTSISLKVINK